jgi:hypothetical protein
MTDRVWSDQAKRVLDFLYRFWAEHRRPPDVSDVARGTGLGFRSIRRSYRELQEGFAVVADDTLLNLNLQKVTPFSATPTPVSFEHRGHFHSYLGCPAEALTVGAMPMFCEDVLTIRSCCSCCYESIEIKVRRSEIVEASPVEPIILFVASPYDWEEGVAADHVCDSIRFVLDEEHAKRFERQIGRTGVRLTLAQLQAMARPIGEARMWDEDWPPIRVDGEAMVAGLAKLGVDVSNWQEPELPPKRQV